MSNNELNSSTQTCQNCIHKKPSQNSGLFFCKLHDENYLKDLPECEDWEEHDLSDSNVYECD